MPSVAWAGAAEPEIDQVRELGDDLVRDGRRCGKDASVEDLRGAAAAAGAGGGVGPICWQEEMKDGKYHAESLDGGERPIMKTQTNWGTSENEAAGRGKPGVKRDRRAFRRRAFRTVDDTFFATAVLWFLSCFPLRLLSSPRSQSSWHVAAVSISTASTVGRGCPAPQASATVFFQNRWGEAAATGARVGGGAAEGESKGEDTQVEEPQEEPNTGWTGERTRQSRNRSLSVLRRCLSHLVCWPQAIYDG